MLGLLTRKGFGLRLSGGDAAFEYFPKGSMSKALTVQTQHAASSQRKGWAHDQLIDAERKA